MTRSVVCSVFCCGVHGVNVAYSSFLGSCERERFGCFFGFRGSYSGILPNKFRILYKFAALAGSCFDKFVRFSWFTDPSRDKLCRASKPSLAFDIFAFLVVSRRLHWGPSAVQFQVAEFIVLFPGHHPRAWLCEIDSAHQATRPLAIHVHVPPGTSQITAQTS